MNYYSQRLKETNAFIEEFGKPYDSLSDFGGWPNGKGKR